jgi:hypothetical protein
MADQRISQLTKLAQGDVAANDVLAIVDVGASTTKKVEAKDLFQAGANLADSASIDLIKLNQASATKLGTTALADDAVTAAKLADDSSIVYDSVAPSANNFEGRGYVNSTSKNLQVWDGSAFQQVVAPITGIENLAVTTGKLANNAVTTAKVDAAGLAAAALATDSVITAKIQDLAVTTGKLAELSVTTAKIAADAVTADELASNAVVTASIVDANVTEAKLATGSVTEAKIATGAVTVGKIADTQITYAKLNLADGSVPGAKLVSNSVTSTQMAVNSVTTGALTDLNVTTGKLADSAVTNAKLATGAITTAKIDGAGLGEAAIATSAVTTTKVLDGAITAAKLAADSTTIVQAGTPVGSGAYEGQLWFDTNTSVKYVWNGSAWIRQAALNVINFSDTTPLNFAVAYPDNHTANITTTLDTQNANAVFVGPTSGADAAPTFRALTPADLPNATASTKGIVQPGTGLAVNAGVLNHSNTVTPGTYTRLVVDAQGHISQGQLLEASDIPNLDAAKITTGALPTARLADAAVTIDKLADYSTASIGVEFPAATFTGQLHLNSLDRSFYMWDGNVWVPIGISAGQIVFAGTFDASDPANRGKVASVTPEGTAAGFTVGSALPASSLANNSYYLVVSEGGTISNGNAPHVALAPPDLILSVYSAISAAWVEIDVSSGAGAIAASQVSFAATGDIAASNVQTAIEEVSTECRNATNITSGTLAVARGGTNVASYTKGDLLAASASTTLTKLPVGTNGQVLRANSATATGLEYGADFVGTVTTVTSSTAALTVATASTTPALTIRAATTSVDGIVQLSDSTGTTSSVLAATPTAVKSAYDLAALALPKSGGTVTGELLIGNAGTLVFEGSTNDGNEITLAVADPTADRTITLPNQTGTVLLSSNGSIVNADVNTSAAIAGTKINPDFGSQTVTTSGIFSHALGSVSAPTITFTGDTNTGLYSPGADTLAFVEGGVEAMRIDSSGNVGIGGSPSAFRLDVLGGTQRILNQGAPSALEIGYGTATNQTAYIDLVGDTTYTDFGFRIIRNVTGANANTDLIHRGTGGLGFLTQDAAPIAFYTTSTERARIDSSGRFGIGTSAPGTSLDVQLPSASATIGNIRITPSTAGQARYHLYNAGSVAEWLFGQKTSTDHKFKISTSVAGSETDVFTIDTSGNIGINTTSPAAPLDVFGNQLFSAANPQIQFNAGGPIIRVPSANTIAFLTDSTTERARIDSSGRFLVGTSTSIGVGAKLQTVEDGNANPLELIASPNNEQGPSLNTAKARGSTASPTVVSSGDILGRWRFRGYDGSAYQIGAEIAVQVDGTPGTNDMPGRLVFSTTSDGAASPTERMRIKSNGTINFLNVATYADNTAALAGGLVAGDVYRKSDGTLMITY